MTNWFFGYKLISKVIMLEDSFLNFGYENEQFQYKDQPSLVFEEFRLFA